MFVSEEFCITRQDVLLPPATARGNNFTKIIISFTPRYNYLFKFKKIEAMHYYEKILNMTDQFKETLLTQVHIYTAKHTFLIGSSNIEVSHFSHPLIRACTY